MILKELNIQSIFNCYSWSSLVAQLVKNPPAMQETWVWSLGLIPGLGRSPGWGRGNPRLENPQGQRSLAGCSPWGGKESDSFQRLSLTQHSTGLIYLFLTTLGLPRCAWTFSSCGKVQGWGCALLQCLSCSCGFSRGAPALEHRLSCSAACGLFPAQE